MGTFLELFLLSQLLSSLSSLSTDLLLPSASLLVGSDLAGGISSGNVNDIIQIICILKTGSYLSGSSLPSTHTDPLLVLKK